MSLANFDFEDFFIGYSMSAFLDAIKASIEICTIAEGVKLLQQSPFYSGKSLIEDADVCFKAGDDKGGKKSLEKAIEKFRDAASQNEGTIKVVSYFYAARCCERIGKPWLRDKNYKRTFKALLELEESVKITVTAKGLIAGGIGGVGVGAIYGAAIAFPLLIIPAAMYGVVGAAIGAGNYDPNFVIEPLQCKVSELKAKIK